MSSSMFKYGFHVAFEYATMLFNIDCILIKKLITYRIRLIDLNFEIFSNDEFELFK